MKRVHVAAAVIRRDNKIFVAKRPDHLHMGGLWEFPGGKVESGETVQAALARELLEELGIVVCASSPLIQVPYDYPDKSVLLDVWEVPQFDGEPTGLEGQETRWVEASSLKTLAFPAANKPIVDAACLPPVCAISRPAESLPAWLADLQAGMALGHRLFILRPPLGFDCDLTTLFDAVNTLPMTHEVQWQWHGKLFADLEQACEALADFPHFGLHLPASPITAARLPERMLVSASCHSEQELGVAQSAGARFLLLSPVAATKDYADHQLLGWPGFSDCVSRCQVPVYGLGGLSVSDVEPARAHGGQGVALQRRW